MTNIFLASGTLQGDSKSWEIKILRKEVTDEVSLLLFLIDVAVWKEPYETQAKEMIKLVTQNTYREIKSAFNKVQQALADQKMLKL